MKPSKEVPCKCYFCCLRRKIIDPIASIIAAQPHVYLLVESTNGAPFPYHLYQWAYKSLDRQLRDHCVITMFDNDLMPRHTFSQPDAEQRIGAALLPQVSPIAWQPIHRCRCYECTKAPEVMQIAAIMQALAQAPVLHNSCSHPEICLFGLSVTIFP
jgi:hypothetical protein